MMEPKRIERLYKQSYISYFATYAGAVLAYWLFQDITPGKILNSWFIIFSLFTFIRVAITWQFKRIEHNNDLENWFIVFLVATAISGTMWGLTGFLFLPKGSLPLLDSVLYHGILLLFVATLIAGSIITYSASKVIFLSFSIPAIIPQCLMLVDLGDKYHSFLGGVILVYVAIMFFISVYINRIFAENSNVEEQNEALKSVIEKHGIKIEE
jgi:hypothetical protein